LESQRWFKTYDNRCPVHHFTDIILKSLIEHARELVAPYTDPNAGHPEASYTLRLPNEVMLGSNLFAVQKTFDGSFQFDVYYESASNKQELNGESVSLHL